MTPREFCFWLHGYMELTPEFKGLTADQVKVIEDHLDLVFEKVTPDRDLTLPPLPPSSPFTLPPDLPPFVPQKPLYPDNPWGPILC